MTENTKAVAQRRPLLSTLAQTIAMISCRAKSPFLREKLSRARSAFQGYSTPSTNGVSILDSAETKLWFLLHHTGYEPEANIKLKQLKFDDTKSVHIDKAGSMLDNESLYGAAIESTAFLRLSEDSCKQSTSHVDDLLDDTSAWLDPGDEWPVAADEELLSSVDDFEEDLFWGGFESSEDLLTDVHNTSFCSPDAGGSVKDDDEMLEDTQAGSYADLDLFEDLANACYADDPLLFGENDQGPDFKDWDILLES